VTLDELRRLLEHLAPDLDRYAAPWGLIGSGALMLIGAPFDEAADLDVVTSAEAARRLLDAWAAWRVDGPSKAPDGPFRSEVFARFATPWGAVEVMGGLRVRGAALAIEALESGPPLPTAAEQLRILRLFGRPKDLEKAARLEAWLTG
jgi:hypothetical protein